MKKSGTILFLTLCMTMTACSTPKKEEAVIPAVETTAAQTTGVPTSQPSTAAEEESEINDYEYDPAMEDGDINPYDSDAGVPFDVDESLLSMLPTEGISVYEAQKIIKETIEPEAEFTLPEGYWWMLYRYSGLMEMEGEPCYRIEFGAYNDIEFVIERTFAVSLLGELYEGVPGTDAYAPYEMYAAHYDVKGDDMEPISEEEAIRRLQYAMELMGETNKVIRREGTEIIDGESCRTFSAGDYSTDGQKYTAMYHYAVSDSGMLYYMDITEGADWLLFYTAEE